jgi:hypothetical protein
MKLLFSLVRENMELHYVGKNASNADVDKFCLPSLAAGPGICRSSFD